MKKILSIIILTFMLSAALVGCVPDGSQESDKDNGINGGESTDGKGDSTENGENNTENGGNNSTEGGEDSENSGGGSTEGGENSENGGNGSTESGENGGQNEGKEENPPTPEVGTEVGDLFASITLERLDGGTVSPDDYRGKIVILNIWATRCPPCKAELPDFNRIASKYADEVVIIAAHDYYGRAGAPDYVAENFPDTKIIFAYDTIYSDAYTAAGGDGYIPFTAILDQNGVIVYSDSGMLSYDQLDKMLSEMLSE